MLCFFAVTLEPDPNLLMEFPDAVLLEVTSELAKTLIWCHTPFTNPVFNLHASTTPVDNFLNAFKNVSEPS